MEIRLLNDKVPDQILVKGQVTKRSTEYSTNLFCDPTDPEETAYYEDELTPVEKGHYYLWKDESGTGSVIVHMPYKIMDRETGDMLSGLTSYRSLGRMISRSIPQRLTLRPVSCLQDFLLSRPDFNTFSKRVEVLGGVLVKDEVNLELLLPDTKALTSRANEIRETISSLREKYCLQSSDEKIVSEEHLQEILNEFAWIREEVEQLSGKRASVVKRLQGLKDEVNRETDYIRASSEHDRAQEAIRVLSTTNFDRITREAIHKFNVDCEVGSAQVIPAHIGNLSSALNELRQWYPSLTKLSAHGDNVVIDLSGLRIVLTPTSIQVDGDPAVLKPYIEGSGSTIDSSGNASLRRRRRSIVSEVKE